MIDIQFWHVLAVVTAGVWVAFFVWPRRPISGYSAIEDGIINLIFGMSLMIATLASWVAYFVFLL